MKFLNKFSIILKDVPAYTDFNQEWSLPLDYHLCHLLLESDDPRLTPQMKKRFRPLVEHIDKKTGVLTVKYKARSKGGVGRRYCEEQGEPFYTDKATGEQKRNNNYNKYASSLTPHSKFLKNTIFHYLGWRDYDQKKGHPTILYELGERNGVFLTAFKEYIDDFDNICEEMLKWYSVETEEGNEPDEEYLLTKNDIKKLFNSRIYGGGHYEWVNEITHTNLTPEKLLKLQEKGKVPKDMKNINNYHPFYKRFDDDAKLISKLICEANPEIIKTECDGYPDDTKEKFSKVRNRCMSVFCGIVENELTFRAYQYASKNGLCEKKKVEWAYDGFAPPPSPAFTDYEFHLKEMNAYVKLKTGFKRVCFVEKEISKDYIVWSVIEARRNLVIAEPVNPPIVEVNGELQDDVASVMTDNTSVVLSSVINDDNEGANILYLHLQDRLKVCGGAVFFKKDVVWESSKQKVDLYLLNFILSKTNLKKMGGGKSPSPKPYSTNVSGARALRDALYSVLYADAEDETLLNKFVSTTRGRLCFLDGVLDVTAKDASLNQVGKFYKWDEVDFEYYTPVQIQRDFADYFASPDTTVMDTIKKDIFETLFNKDCEKALHFFARGVAGEFEDKTWGLLMGNRNCGKGVIDTLSKTALGKYHANFEGTNLLCNSSRFLKQEQPEKQLAFVLDIQFARLAFSQELPPPTKNKTIKVNADLIKKINSGGDPLKGKRNYDVFITEFTNMSRMIVMCNDCPEFTNDDALETCCEFNSTISFKPKCELDELKKTKCELVLRQYREGDPLIKDKCKTDEYANAFIMLMVQNYKDEAVSCVRDETIVDIAGEKEEKDDVGGGLREFIINSFQLTNSKTDFIKNADIIEVFEALEFGDISIKKIGIELKAIGMINAKGTNGVRGWLGLKKKVVDDEPLVV